MFAFETEDLGNRSYLNRLPARTKAPSSSCGDVVGEERDLIRLTDDLPEIVVETIKNCFRAAVKREMRKKRENRRSLTTQFVVRCVFRSSRDDIGR